MERRGTSQTNVIILLEIFNNNVNVSIVYGFYEQLNIGMFNLKGNHKPHVVNLYIHTKTNNNRDPHPT